MNIKLNFKNTFKTVNKLKKIYKYIYHNILQSFENHKSDCLNKQWKIYQYYTQ